jgi:hypothetical protein
MPDTNQPDAPIEIKTDLPVIIFDDVVDTQDTTNVWTAEHEKHLSKMNKDAEKYYVLYKQCSQRYYKIDVYMSFMTIVLTSVMVATNTLSVYSELLPQKIISVVISLFLTILYAIEKKYKFIKRVEQYSNKSSEFVKLSRKIGLVLSTQQKSRKSPVEVLVTLDKEMTSLMSTELYIDDDLEDNYNKTKN